MNLAFGRCRDINGPLMEAALALYRSSFPAHELRLPPDQRDVMGNPLYHFDMCLLDGALAGLILYWDFGTYIYVEHFCVEPSLRGHGLGTLILAELARQNKTIILEIDPLVDDASVRRKGFLRALRLCRQCLCARPSAVSGRQPRPRADCHELSARDFSIGI